MARATRYSTPPSRLFCDPFLRDAFAGAEDDGLAPSPADVDNPPVLSGGAAELVPADGRRVRALETA